VKAIFILLLLAIGQLTLQSQTIRVTFTGTGVGAKVDSVTALNLSTNQSVTFPGSDTLILMAQSGVTDIPHLSLSGFVFPNPFYGTATLTAIIGEPQLVNVNLLNLNGQIVAKTQSFIQAGESDFAIAISDPGIYVVTIANSDAIASTKIVCIESSSYQNRIELIGSASGIKYRSGQNQFISDEALLKSTKGIYGLNYTPGDKILYQCRSGIYTTVLTDSVTFSKNYDVEFVACLDADERNYGIVKIGEQTWMAENLAWLPAVSPSGSGSGTDKHYYVYLYDGTLVSEAKATNNYSTYGVLYNWPAAMNGAAGSLFVPSGVQGACPANWHLPGDGEWKILEKYLGMSDEEADLTIGKRATGLVGKQLKSSTGGWATNGNGNNWSGFTALPGGCRFYTGLFTNQGYLAQFWTATGYDENYTMLRSLSYNNDGIERGYWEETSGYYVRCIRNDMPNNNKAPEADFSVNTESGNTETVFKFDASGCSDAENSLSELLVCWDWTDDGIFDTEYSAVKTIDHQYLRAGYYTVRMKVKDKAGLIDNKTKTVAVKVPGSGDGTFTDKRDGLVYFYKTIGTQTWMAENLAWLPFVSPAESSTESHKAYYVPGYLGTNVNEARLQSNYTIYGVLYNWPAAMNGSPGSSSTPSGVRGVCPEGWHLPGDEEWEVLEKYLGMSDTDADANDWRTSGQVGQKLKSAAGSWEGNGNGDNSSGFSALPAGSHWTPGGFSNIGYSASFWSATDFDSLSAWNRSLIGSSEGVSRLEWNKAYGFSVRCMRIGTIDNMAPIARLTANPQKGTTLNTFLFDATGSTDEETDPKELLVRWDWNGDGTWDTDFGLNRTNSHKYSGRGGYQVIIEVKDGGGLSDTESLTLMVGDSVFIDSRDGKEYTCIKIGEQTWMSENLAWLPSVSPSAEGSNTSLHCYVNGYEGSIVTDAKKHPNFSGYGVLYNGEAAKAACPPGWKLPSDEDWKNLEKILGMTPTDADEIGIRISGSVGNKLKSLFLWSEAGNGDNTSGFTALPGGCRYFYGGCGSLGSGAAFWTSSIIDSLSTWSRSLYHDYDGVIRFGDDNSNGYSVRCIRE
jgi:uncharacterized protein (TIGR02145 family)